MEPSAQCRRPAASPPDGDLVAGVRSGDERSFEQLVDRYRGTVDRLRLRPGSATSVRSEDIAQEVFISALRGMRAERAADRLQARGSTRSHATHASISTGGAAAMPSRRLDARIWSSSSRRAIPSGARAPPATRDIVSRLRRAASGRARAAGDARARRASYAELAASTGLDGVSGGERAPPGAPAAARPLSVVGRVAPRRGIPPAARWRDSGREPAVGYCSVHRGVAQPGSAHRSGR